MNKIVIAADHGGIVIKNALIEYFTNNVMEYRDLGTHDDVSVDYPKYATALCETLQADELGILLCGTGIGMSIKANRYPHIRAALCHDATYARLAREHNDANVLVLGGRFLTAEQAVEIVQTFCQTDFMGGRHSTRIDML